VLDAGVHKLSPGLTLVDMNKPSDDVSDEVKARKKGCGEWSNVTGTLFNVRRGPDYDINKLKAPSAESLYDVVAVDIYNIPRKIYNIGRYFDTSSLLESKQAEETPADGLPKLLLVNIMCPLYAPGIFYSAEDGEGFQTLFWLRLKPTNDDHPKTQAHDLLDSYVKSDEDNYDFRSRLKCMARCTNMDELNLGAIVGGLVNQYNSKPFLVRRKSDRRWNEIEFFKGENYYEIDVDCHHFGQIFANGLWYLQSALPSIRAQFGVVIEAREEDEMPEQMLCSLEIFGAQHKEASKFPFKLPSLYPDADEPSQSLDY